MRLLAGARQRAYEICAGFPCGPFFMRLSRQTHALWVSDWPRNADTIYRDNCLVALKDAGFVWDLESYRNLLFLDLSLEEYGKLLQPLPLYPPAFPVQESLHQAYELCRFLLLHPSPPLASQPAVFLREILKLTDSPHTSKLLNRIPALHEQCAAWLRQASPLPYGAGRILAAWIKEQNRTE